MTPQPIQFQTVRQERIHRRLGLVGEGPQAFYRDALRLIGGSPLVESVESVTHVVGHLVREIESALRDVLEPIAHYEGQKAKNRSNAHEREVKIILRELGLSESEGVGAAWLQIAKKGLAEYAHRRALERPRSFDEGFRTVWDEVESIFDVVLNRFESRYLDLHNEIDRLLQRPVPSQRHLTYLETFLPNNPATRFYFFGQLNHAGWLGPLNEAGFFREPPSAIRDEVSGTITFPQWPALPYLERMAQIEDQQELVLAILLAVPTTDNPYIHDGLAAILLKLPPALAQRATDRLSTWMPSSEFSLLAEKLGSLATRLALDGNVDEGFAVLRTVLDPQRMMAAAKGRQSHAEYEYGEVLKKELPVFVTHWPRETLSFLCALLEEATSSTDDDTARWGSYHWRRSITAARAWRRYEVLDLLVDAVRDASIGIVRKDTAHLRVALNELDSHNNDIFCRIALYLLTTFPRIDIDEVERRILDRQTFERWHEAREYVGLLSSVFGDISIKVRNEVLKWIDSGPDLAHYEPDNPADAQRIVDRWQRVRLNALRDKLPDEWRQRLEALELAQPPLADEADDDGVRWGPTSPRSAEDLKAMDVDDIVAFLRTWKPKSGWHESSQEGLGRTLTSVVAANPAPMAEHANAFKGLEPTYVRALLQGLEEALKGEHSFSWMPVLDLCRWIVELPHEHEDWRSDWNRDPGWSWSRKRVAGLMAAGVDSATNPIEFGCRELLWQILEPLTWDPDPTPERDANREAADALQLAINSVRGDAMAALIRYAVWVEKHRRSLGAEPLGMAGMPEVRQNFNDHLDVDRERSPAIRAIFGETFPVLCWLDQPWATYRVETIFPTTEIDRQMFEAAWVTYVRFNHPYIDVFTLLSHLYEKAVNELEAADRQHVDHDSYEQQLAAHLMTYYWYGVSKALDLARKFFEKADVALRRSALDFVGRSLGSDRSEPAAADAVARLRDLWDWRFSIAHAAGEFRELETFGWWLASGEFDPRWASERALQVLNTGTPLEPDHVVMQFLETFVASEPLASAKILEGVLDNVRDHWTVHGWKDEARNVLQAALSSGNDEAKHRARAVINKFAARGHLEFRDLLDPPQGPEIRSTGLESN